MVKTCTKCKVRKLESEFYKEKLGKNGLMSRCKACINKQNSDYVKNNHIKRGQYKKQYSKTYLVNQALKHDDNFYKKNKSAFIKCSKCNVEKEAHEYYKCPTNPSGYRTICVSCCAEMGKLRVYDNEKIRKRMQHTCAELKDPYIKHRLKRKGFTNDSINANPELIEATRSLLKIKRYVKEKTGKKHSGA